MTFNAWGNLNHFEKSRKKNAYKNRLIEWHIPEPSKVYTTAIFEFTPTYKDNRKRDSDNIIPSVKYFIDAMTKCGWLKDDDLTKIIINPRTVNKTIPEHNLNVKATFE